MVGYDVAVETAHETAEMVLAGVLMILMQPCHLADPPDCRALVELAVRTHGRIDVLFNLAAESYFNGLEDITKRWSWPISSSRMMSSVPAASTPTYLAAGPSSQARGMTR